GSSGARASEERRSHGGEATDAKVYHAVYVNRIYSASRRASARLPLWLLRRAARRCYGRRCPRCGGVLSDFARLSRKHVHVGNHPSDRESKGRFNRAVSNSSPSD